MFKSLIKFYSSSIYKSPLLSNTPNYLNLKFFYGGVSVIYSADSSLIYFLGGIIVSVSSISLIYTSSNG